MPPLSFWGFSWEWDMLTSAPTVGATVFSTDFPSSMKNQPVLAANMASHEEPNATVRLQHCIFTARLVASPTKLRPRFSASTTLCKSKEGEAPCPWQADHTFGLGLGRMSGKPNLEWCVSHPTFTLNVEVQPDGKSIPIEGNFSVASCADVDAGAYFSYDPLRSGLTSYILGLRYDMSKVVSKLVLAAQLNDSNTASVILHRNTTTAKGYPLQYGVKVSDNGRKGTVAVGMDSPCGRKLGVVADLWSSRDLTLWLKSPLSDAWRVSFVAKPLKAGLNVGWLGVKLEAN